MASVLAFEKGWLKSSTGSNGPLTLAEEDSARRARKGLGLDRKAGGPTPERSAASGVAAGPVCQLWRGSPDRPGRATGTGRSALGQRLDRAAGSKWGSLFPSTGRSPERGSAAVLLGKRQHWQQKCSQPYCDKAFRCCQKCVAKSDCGNKLREF